MYQPQLHQHFIDQRRHDLEARASRYRRTRRAFAGASHRGHPESASY